jgi:hypothetical protein
MWIRHFILKKGIAYKFTLQSCARVTLIEFFSGSCFLIEVMNPFGGVNNDLKFPNFNEMK